MTAGYWLMKNEAGSAQYPMLQFDIDQQTSRAVDVARLIVPKINDVNLSFGDDLSIVHQNAGGTANIIDFGGYLTDKNVGDDMDITIESYGGILNRTNIEEVYYAKSPEYILQNMVDNNTDLTYASTGTSGLSLSKFRINNQTIAWAIKEFSNLVDWAVTTDVNRNLYYAPKGETISSETLNVYDNCYMKGDWDKVPDRIINEVIFVGDVQKFNTSESFTATASQTDFVVVYAPSGNVRVTDNGTEVTGGVSGSTGTFDYTWDADTKTITFEVGVTEGHTIIISYEYETPIKITARNDVSFDAYGLYSKKITNKAIKSMAEARSYVQTILDKYAEPGVRGTIIGPTSLNVAVGELIQVNDNLNSISEQMVIQRLKEKYPDGVYEILVGSQEFKMMDWQTEIEARLKKLEDEQDNASLVQVYRSVNEPLIVTFDSKSYAFFREIYNAPQWNVAVWNVDHWDDTREGDMFNGFSGDAYGVAHYKFEESAGTAVVNDSSRNRHSGTANKSTSGLSTAGKVGSAFLFDGTNDFITMDNLTELDGCSAFSICVWLKPDVINFNQYRGVFTRGDNNQRCPWIFGIYNTATVTCQFETDYGTTDGNAPSANISAGVWSHLTWTWDGTTLTPYVNATAGTPDTTIGHILATSNTQAMIGSLPGYYKWDGSIDDLRVYTKCLSQAEINAIYNSGIGTESAFNDVWEHTGSAVIASNQLKMSAGVGSAQSAIYRGWEWYYTNHNARVILDMDKSASVGTLDFDFRMSGTGRNGYAARFDFASDKVAVVTKNAGTVSGIIGSASNTFATGSNVMYLIYQDDKIWLYKSGSFLLDLTDSTYTNTGTVGFRWGGTQSGTSSVSLNSFKIYKGD